MALKNISAPQGSSSAVTSSGVSRPRDGASSKESSKDANKAGAVAADLGATKASSAMQSPLLTPNTSDKANKNYGVELSDKGRTRAAEQKKAFDIAKSTPDIREDKVAAIKAKVQNGTYEVDSGKIADGMLREALMEHLATSKDN